MHRSSRQRTTQPTQEAHDRAVIRDYVHKAMSGLSRLECAVCGRVNGFDFYMVSNRVWKEAKLARGASCCLDCLSRRLGRELMIHDFDPSHLLNRPLIFGYRLALARMKQAGGRVQALGEPPMLPPLPRRPRASRPCDGPATFGQTAGRG